MPSELIDIGANIGQYSIYAAVKIPSLQVYAFEPFGNNYQRMCDNITLNKTDNVIPLLVGLSDLNTEISSKDDTLHSLASTSIIC